MFIANQPRHPLHRNLFKTAQGDFIAQTVMMSFCSATFWGLVMAYRNVSILSADQDVRFDISPLGFILLGLYYGMGFWVNFVKLLLHKQFKTPLVVLAAAGIGILLLSFCFSRLLIFLL